MLVNGQPTDQVALDDRGLLYGDGVFETIAVHGARAWAWARHLRRVTRGCERLAIAAPKPALLEADAARLIRHAERAVLKLIVTRGRGGRGYRPDPSAQATRIVTLHPWPAHPVRYREAGIVATICRTTLAPNTRLAGIKHLNRLEQVLARGEWGDEYQEGLMLDDQGKVIEGTMSNVFVLNGQRLCTPDVSRAGVAGIMRERILEAAPGLGLTTQVSELSLAAVKSAEALFFCNSVIGVWPVRELDDISYRCPAVIHELARTLEVSE